ncbi:MAG: hypothetical protein C6W57_05015 [Caldibacillus debilis]|nr:hypothetical protein [Bacillaceae bacterium]REJ17854.1 MAG: hypothetical protein C6W57_05015 [Caldibacillus debilis]REJ23342.1 MAG: hypothetical protein C6W56_15365 [Caldibacillus debilis]
MSARRRSVPFFWDFYIGSRPSVPFPFRVLPGRRFFDLPDAKAAFPPLKGPGAPHDCGPTTRRPLLNDFASSIIHPEIPVCSLLESFPLGCPAAAFPACDAFSATFYEKFPKFIGSLVPARTGFAADFPCL